MEGSAASTLHCRRFSDLWPEIKQPIIIHESTIYESIIYESIIQAVLSVQRKTHILAPVYDS